ncbi:MAG: DUF5063 domain-containing protein [Actinomycetota bacterium]
MAEDFARAAVRFCSVIEQAGAVPLQRWLRDAESALANAYASAVALPAVGPATMKPLPRMSHDEWAALYDELRAALGAHDSYAVVLGEGDRESIVAASLADDLAEIYQELRSGLDASTSGAPPEDVLFEWRTAFEIHWASHAVGALGALRRVMQQLDDAS